MAQTLERRITHKYRDGWRSEDAWETLGTVKVVTRYEEQTEQEDYDAEPGTMLLCEVALTDPAVAEDEVRRALQDTFSGSGCRHDWDCCGCLHTTARARLLDGTVWMVLQSHYRNL